MASKIRPKGRNGLKQRLTEFGRHLVYAEGEKTEPLYVENVKRILNGNTGYRNSIVELEVVKGASGKQTIDILKYAVCDVKERLKRDENIDYVWIFYDRDSFPKDSFDNTYHSIMSKNFKENADKNIDNNACDKDGISWNAC